MRVLRAAVGFVGELLITAGVLLLLFLGWQLWWTDVVADQEQAVVVASLVDEFESARPVDSIPPIDGRSPGIPQRITPEGVPSGKAFAIIRIPRFGVDYARPVLEDTTRSILEQGVGHYRDTAMPGELGNFSVAGHRTTYGKPFNQIHTLVKGDKIIVQTQGGFAVYAVSEHEIVRPDEVWVIDPVPGEKGATPTKAIMTMTACHPMFSARQRWITHSELVGVYPRAEDIPGEYLEVPEPVTEG